MEYLFGTRNGRETLRTKDTAHTKLYGFHEIDHHFRNVDRTPPLYDAGADVDELLVDYELRIIMLELGLEE